MSRAGRRSRRGDIADLIQAAVKQLEADEFYERCGGNTVAETLRHLKDIKRYAEALRATIDALSPVAKAAMFEAGVRRGRETGRYELAGLADQLVEFAESAGSSIDRIVEMHSSWSESGQGTGSAMGRDSDLRAIRADHDRQSDLPPFRSPKDKFAVAIVKALIRHGFDPSARGAARELQGNLDRLWSEHRNGPAPNWTRVVKARHAIGRIVERDRAAERVWRKVQAKRNATSRNDLRCPPKESRSYVVAADHSGENDVYGASEGCRESAGPERQHSEQVAYPRARPALR